MSLARELSEAIVGNTKEEKALDAIAGALMWVADADGKIKGNQITITKGGKKTIVRAENGKLIGVGSGPLPIKGSLKLLAKKVVGLI